MRRVVALVLGEFGTPQSLTSEPFREARGQGPSSLQTVTAGKTREPQGLDAWLFEGRMGRGRGRGRLGGKSWEGSLSSSLLQCLWDKI